MLRSLPYVLATFALIASCSDVKPAKTPSLTLTYRPSPPVAGQRLELDFEGSDVGAVEIYQGADLLTRLFNPVARDVPASLFTFTALNAEAPRAVMLDADGNRIEVKATPASGTPTPIDAGPAPIVDAGPVDEGPPDSGIDPALFKTTCQGFDSVGDAGYTDCLPPTRYVEAFIRNDRNVELTVWYGLNQFNICNARRFEIDPGEVKSWAFGEGTWLDISESGNRGDPIARYQLRAGAATPCYLSVP